MPSAAAKLLAGAAAGSATALSSGRLRLTSLSCLSRLASLRACSTTAGGGNAPSPSPLPASPWSKPHPWPEWMQFLEKLRGKGYLEYSEGLGVEMATGGRYTEIVKDACIKFARERYDLLRYLPMQDIQSVVACGCPTTSGKAVDSAKRLRAYLQLDESKVCANCKSHKSCGRAYLPASEKGGARTVDIVRILSTYTTDAYDILGSSIDTDVQKSARKLLSELVALMDTTIDPSLSKLVFSPPVKTDMPANVDQRVKQSIRTSKQPHEVEMKRGDWLCPNCNYLNFSRNLRCLECKSDGPRNIDCGSVEMKLGDWTCPTCEFMNFSRNKKCLRCNDIRPRRNLSPGEWECPSCSYVNFSRNKECRKCNHECPEAGSDERERTALIKLQPGDWDCPSCSFVNFSRNKVCKKCNIDRPLDDGDRYNNNSWRKPIQSVESKSFSMRNYEDGDENKDGYDSVDHERQFVENIRQRRLKMTIRDSRSNFGGSMGDGHLSSDDAHNLSTGTSVRKQSRTTRCSDISLEDDKMNFDIADLRKSNKYTNDTAFRFGYADANEDVEAIKDAARKNKLCHGTEGQNPERILKGSTSHSNADENDGVDEDISPLEIEEKYVKRTTDQNDKKLGTGSICNSKDEFDWEFEDVLPKDITNKFAKGSRGKKDGKFTTGSTDDEDWENNDILSWEGLYKSEGLARGKQPSKSFYGSDHNLRHEKNVNKTPSDLAQAFDLGDGEEDTEDEDILPSDKFGSSW